MALVNPEDLHDGAILSNMDRHMGRGVQIGEFQLARQQGEVPISFVARVKGEYRAWYNRKEAEALEQARSREASNRETAPRSDSSVLPRAVQDVEADLGATLEAQVNGLRARCQKLQQEISEAESKLVSLNRDWQRYADDLTKAERWLREYNDNKNPPQAIAAMGGDLDQEVGRGVASGGEGVGEPNGPTGLRREGESDHSGHASSGKVVKTSRGSTRTRRASQSAIASHEASSVPDHTTQSPPSGG